MPVNASVDLDMELENDLDKLTAMTNSLVQILDSVVTAREVLFPQELREPIELSWSEFNERHREAILDAIRAADDNDLASAGLTASNLELKFRGFRSARKRFIVRGGLKALKEALGWANVWLPSLTSVIKVSEILKEIKEAIEKVLGHIG